MAIHVHRSDCGGRVHGKLIRVHGDPCPWQWMWGGVSDAEQICIVGCVNEVKKDANEMNKYVNEVNKDVNEVNKDVNEVTNM